MDFGETREVIRLPWKPPYNPEAQSEVASAMVAFGRAARGEDKPQYKEYWYIEMDILEGVARPIIEEYQRSGHPFYGTLDPEEPDHWFILPSYCAAPCVADIDPFSGYVEGKVVIFVPYEPLEAGGYLLHTREQYQVQQTAVPVVPEPSI